MDKPLDAQTLSLLRYEATMLSYTGLHLIPRPRSAIQPSPPGIYGHSATSSPICAGTLSAEYLAQPSPSAPPAITDAVVINALCESFLVHYRVLAEFLCTGTSGHPDQILITKFVDTPPVTKGTPIYNNLLLCHQRLAHLSSARVQHKHS